MLEMNLRDCSGPWTGFWILELVRGNMRLHLKFANDNIDGGGNDPIGEFGVNGIFSDETQRVIFTQVYKTHTVDYSGIWDGTMIHGKWTLNDEIYTETGDFEIWPEKELEELTVGTAEVEKTSDNPLL